MAYEWIVDALDETWTSIDRTLRGCGADVYEASTPCPGWSVRDVLSHLIGFELVLNGGAVPVHEGPWPSHVKNPIGELNEAFVEAYRRQSGDELLDLFRDITGDSLERLRSLSDEEWEKVGWSPEGERPLHRFQETRVLDSWIHLQDIRDALLEPSDDHGPGEEIVVNRFEAALPYVLGKKAQAPDGTVVRINLSGHLARSILLGVEDGRARALEESANPPSLELTTPVALFWRRAAGRISADAFLGASATGVRGDEVLARALAEALAIMI
ncbi:MAG: maleylpyruvate isomerase family mycothiol-dependent enzyme [Acidimicrobiales bacterium]